MYRYITLAALLAAASPAHSGELPPNAGESIQLGSIRGVIYYTESSSGYTVVTTLADGQSGLPVRFVATLTDNQAQKISVPSMPGERTIALEIRRTGDKLIVSSKQALKEELAISRPQVPGK